MPTDNFRTTGRRVWNARGIAIALELYDEHGEPDTAAVFRMVRNGYLKSVRRVGRQLTARTDELEADLSGA
jgi:hypothetical protein